MQTKRIYGPLAASVQSGSQLPIYVTNSEHSSNAALLENRDSPLANSNSIVLDNPDQRITQDVDSMCLSISKITPILLISPFVIGYYIYKVL